MHTNGSETQNAHENFVDFETLVFDKNTHFFDSFALFAFVKIARGTGIHVY